MFNKLGIIRLLRRLVFLVIFLVGWLVGLGLVLFGFVWVSFFFEGKLKNSRLSYCFNVPRPLTSIAPYLSSTDSRAVFPLLRKQKTNQLDSHQRIQLIEITTSSLRSGSPVRHQLNFTLLMEEITCSLAPSSECVGNDKKENQ